MNQDNGITYRIDKNDLIEFTDGAWDEFAIANSGPQIVTAKILGRSIWDFMSGETTKNVYRRILSRVRAGEPVQFNFRCDSPTVRRFLHLKITSLADGGVQFESRTICSEPAAGHDHELTNRTFTGNVFVICSWCNKVKTGDASWHEVEDAINITKLFEVETAPLLSHGICPECLNTILRKVSTQ